MILGAEDEARYQPCKDDKPKSAKKYGFEAGSNYSCHPNTEMYSRGRRGAPAKGVGRVTGARVQISPSPPTKKAHRKVCLFRWRRWRDCSRRRSRRGLGARPPPGADEGSAPEGLTGKKKGEAFRLDVRPLFYYELLYFYTASSRTQEFVNLSDSKTTIETLLVV